MTTVYELALLGDPSLAQIQDLEVAVSKVLSHFDLVLGKDVGWHVQPSAFEPSESRAAAALFFAGAGAPMSATVFEMTRAIPIIPIVPHPNSISTELPAELRGFNCLTYSECGPTRVATALLECAGLLPRQRRVFVSYRRDEARAAAVQLFDAFEARLYDVFLDTHRVAPGDDFQSVLWHRLCDSDVLVMLDTRSYFESRWTAAEFGRALAKGISVLQVSWPEVPPSPRTEVASRIELNESEIASSDGKLATSAVEKICKQLEVVRSQSVAVRRLNLVSKVSEAVTKIRGRVLGVGAANAIHVELADGRLVVAYAVLGVPDSQMLHQADVLSPKRDVAVVYDHLGLSSQWLGYLKWLGERIPSPRWVKAAEVAWDLAFWEE